MRLIFPCSFGLEKPLILELASAESGFVRERFSAQDGRVAYALTAEEEFEEALARLAMAANLHSAVAERCILELLYLEDCQDFELFFDTVRNFPWERYIAEGARFVVDGSSTHSQLHAVPALQSLCKKAVVQRLLEAWGRNPEEELEEDEARGHLSLRFAFTYNQLSLGVDLSGQTLHKRGYRLEGGEAPLKESLAAGILEYLHWPQRGREALADLFCGSGTLAIEAARRLTAQAPGIRRHFALEDWGFFPADILEAERARAVQRHEERLAELRAAGYVGEGAIILASDLDPEQVERARANAQRAGLVDFIRFRVGNALDQDPEALRQELGQERLLLLSNPPYGERLLEQAEVQALEEALGRRWLEGGMLPPNLRWALLTADGDFEAELGYRADKRRKLYNGMLSCTLYQYFREGEHQLQRRRRFADQRGPEHAGRPLRRGSRRGQQTERRGRGPGPRQIARGRASWAGTRAAETSRSRAGDGHAHDQQRGGRGQRPYAQRGERFVRPSSPVRQDQPVFSRAVDGWDEHKPVKSARVWRADTGAQVSGRQEAQSRSGKGGRQSRRDLPHRPAREALGRRPQASWKRRSEILEDGPRQGQELLRKKAAGARLHQVQASLDQSQKRQEEDREQ